MKHIRSNKCTERTSSTGWDRAPSIKVFTSGGGASGLCQRLGDRLAKFQTEDLEI